MKRHTVVAGGLLIVFVAAVAYRRVDAQVQAVAQLVDSANLSMLPDGKRWAFAVAVPEADTQDRWASLHIRRSSEEIDSDQPVATGRRQEWLRASDAEASEMSSWGLTRGSDADRLVALQILDLRDYSESDSIVNPLRIHGGVQSGGATGHLPRSDGLLMGDLVGYSVYAVPAWVEDELCLLQFTTRDQTRVYRYDVVLVVKDDDGSGSPWAD